MATDLTPKAPSVGFVLADVDPKSQPPAGGDAEQVLAKRTSADYDYRWAPPVSLDVTSATVQQALADLASRYSVKDIIGLTLQGRTLTFTWKDGNDNTRTSQALVPVIREENQGVDIAEVDARIAEPARTGSTTRWDKSKVPDDVVYIATQRFTDELLAKLNGIEENAEANVQPDWDATSGDAQILNKPTIPVPRTDSEIDARIATEARAGNTDRWTVAKVPTLATLGGVTPAAASATATTIAHAAALARYTAAEKTKLAGLPAAADLEFDNHPVGTAAALNALSRTTSSLDFVTVTAAISSGITANTVVDSSGTALTSLASGDLLILDHANNRWERVVNLPTTALVSNADIDARILPQARTGNAQTWPTSKVPSLAALGGLTQAQVDLRAAFRFTTLEKTKLAGIPADAERNVKANWDATRGDAEILNKPTIPTLPAAATKAEAEAGTETGTRLWSPLRVKEAIEQLGGDGMGSSSPADFSIAEGRPASAVTITTPATAGTVANPQWTSWNTVGTTAAVAASQAGQVLIAAEVRAERTTPVPGGGGDRILTQARIVRTRGSTDTVLATKDIYGPRNVNTASVQTASKSVSSTLVWHDTAVAADTYKVEVRCSSQLTSRTVQFDTTNNGIFLAAVSGGGGASAVDQATVRGFIDGTFVRDLLQGLRSNQRLRYGTLRNIPRVVRIYNSSGFDALLTFSVLPSMGVLTADLTYSGSDVIWDLDAPGTAVTSFKEGDVLLKDQKYTGQTDATGNLPDAWRISATQVPSDWNASTGAARILNKPTIPGNTEIDARIISTARTGNTGRWPKNKLPSDTAYGTIPAAQVPSDWDATTGVARILNKPTIPAAQVPSDWDATTGVARILNKPTLVTAWTGLSDTPSALTGQGGKHVAVNTAGNALELVDAPAGGGSSDIVYLPVAGFEVSAGNTQLDLTWTANAQAASYESRHKLASASAWGDWTARGTGTSASITGLTNGSEYDVQLRGVYGNIQKGTPAANPTFSFTITSFAMSSGGSGHPDNLFRRRNGHPSTTTVVPAEFYATSVPESQRTFRPGSTSAPGGMNLQYLYNRGSYFVSLIMGSTRSGSSSDLPSNTRFPAGKVVDMTITTPARTFNLNGIPNNSNVPSGFIWNTGAGDDYDASIPPLLYAQATSANTPWTVRLTLRDA